MSRMSPAASDSPSSPTAVTLSPVTTGGGELYRVLIVDDTPSIHEDIGKILGRAPGATELSSLEQSLFGPDEAVATPDNRFEIDSAYQGDEGIAQVAAAIQEGRPYSLAFVDMRMPPGKDGLETIVGIWRLDPRLQIVICSAYSDYSWEEIKAATGDTDQLVILRKPFETIELL